MQQSIILASASATRQHLLTMAGVNFTTIPSPANEEQLKQSQPLLSSADTSVFLAIAKAKAVALINSTAIVIGADQTLEYEAQQFSKPKTIAEAKTQLQTLRGKTHTLHTSVACVVGLNVLWQHTAEAKLTMRNFSDQYLDDYLRDCGSTVLSAVGAYQLENHGIRLFDKIEGDYTTILGLPIIPLLTYLQSRRFIPS